MKARKEAMNELFKRSFQIKETQGTIIADKESGIETAIESIKYHRKELENYQKINPKFFWTLKPTPIPREPIVAKLMAEAAEKAAVGPMAAVAGVISDLAVQAMLRKGCRVAVVEDGGEVSATSDQQIDVALIAGNTTFSRKFGFRLVDFPVGVATSSGRFSHALSFGDADAATIFCRNAGLADAAATATCNAVKGNDPEEAIKQGIETAMSIEGVNGVLIIFQDKTGTAGKIPQIIKVKP